jgi:hypothetical protein
MSVLLTGWYEKENHSHVMVNDESGESLNHIVCRMMNRDVDFGRYKMELELHLPNGEIKLVEKIVRRIVRDV